MFTVGPPKPEPKCPLGRVNVLSSGSTPVGSMRLQEFTWVVLLITDHEVHIIVSNIGAIGTRVLGEDSGRKLAL